MRYGSLCGLLGEFDGGEPSLHGHEFGRNFPDFSERLKHCCSLTPGQLQICQAKPCLLIARIELKLEVKLCLGFFQFRRMQKSLAQRCMQSGLPGLGVERLPVFLYCIFPTAALKQEITEKAMSPGRLTVQVGSPIGQTSRKIQVFVPEFEPRLSLVGIKDRDLAKLLSRTSKVFLPQVTRSQGLACLAVRRIELQCLLKERNGLFWRA